MRTTLWAGAALVVVGAIHLLADAGAGVSVERGIDQPLFGTSFNLFADVLLFVSTVVLAFGAPGEVGVVGPAPVAKAALLLFGAEGLLALLDVVLPGGGGSVWLGIGLTALGLVGGVIAGVAVVRAGSLRGWARWALLVLGLAEVLLFLLQFSLVTVLAAVAIAPLVDLLILAVGIGYLLAGRTGAIAARARAAREQW